MPALRPYHARLEGRLRLHLPELRLQGFLLLLTGAGLTSVHTAGFFWWWQASSLFDTQAGSLPPPHALVSRLSYAWMSGAGGLRHVRVTCYSYVRSSG